MEVGGTFAMEKSGHILRLKPTGFTNRKIWEVTDKEKSRMTLAALAASCRSASNRSASAEKPDLPFLTALPSWRLEADGEIWSCSQ